MKVIWLSRHKLDDKAKVTLIQAIRKDWFPNRKEEDIVLEAKNHIWSATKDEKLDTLINRGAWKGFASENDVIAGIFPPVATASMIKFKKKIIASPVSVQSVIMRDGEKKFYFSFLRWQQMNK